MRTLTLAIILLVLPSSHAQGVSGADRQRPDASGGSINEQFDGARKSIVKVETPSSSGFGFFFKAGFIVTCEHILGGADTAFVSLLADGTKHTAGVAGVDRTTDIAVLKLEIDAPILKIDPTDKVASGESMAAFSDEEEPTRGRVDPRAAFIAADGSFFAVDFGSMPSGACGPVFNSEGDVVGMTAARLRHPTDQPVDFAISSFVLAPAVEELAQKGHSGRGYIGVATKDHESPRGAEIVAFVPGGAAERAGFQLGDVILSLNDKAVEGAKEYLREIQRAKPGHSIDIQLLRGSQKLTVRVIVDAAPY